MRWLVIIAAGCGFQGPPTSSLPIDGGVDAAADAPVSCFGADPFAVCVPEPQLPLALNGDRIDTSPTTASACAGARGVVASMSGTSVCAIGGTIVSIQGMTRIVGSLPLVIVATTTIDVAGTLDASSHGAGDTGPDANSPMCGSPLMTSGTNSTTSAGGGCGGSFGSMGGGGGNGMVAAPGGIANPAVLGTQVILRGGCIGGPGGAGSMTTVKAVGGDGGGAVYLVARGAVTVGGTIDASGGGGSPGLHSAGGGAGGGSGGMIVLAAPALTVTGKIFANGGGGGGGGGTGPDGKAGGDPTAPGSAAPGGKAGDSNATAGGPGGFDAVGAGSATTASTGGGAGGGGGGTGVVRVLTGQAIPPANVSPVPS